MILDSDSSPRDVQLCLGGGLPVIFALSGPISWKGLLRGRNSDCPCAIFHTFNSSSGIYCAQALHGTKSS